MNVQVRRMVSAPALVLAALMMLSWRAAAVSADDAAPANAANSGPQAVQWSNKVYQAFQQACREKKPLVVYFHSVGECKHCTRLETETLTAPSFHVLADRAVFVRISMNDEDEKGNVRQLMNQLGVESVPFITVLDPSPSQIVERGHVLGYFPAEAFVPKIQALLDLPRPADLALTTPAKR